VISVAKPPAEPLSEGCQLYLITPPEIDLAVFPDRLARALDAGPVGCVQLRLPGSSADDLRAAAERLLPMVQQRDIAFLLNGTAALAKELGCDGVHLDRVEDVGAARRVLGDASVGVSCGTHAQQALDAGEDGVDYVSFGPFFSGSERAEIEMLSWWAQVMTLPAVAIGGITADNCAPLVAAGVDFLAVISAVWDHAEGPAAGVTALLEAIARAEATR
jgi:thiamine-phosphate pyrophosphorylase